VLSLQLAGPAAATDGTAGGNGGGLPASDIEPASTPSPIAFDAAGVVMASVVTASGGAVVVALTGHRRRRRDSQTGPRVPYRPQPLQRWDAPA
jgi:hypothetical protein